MTTGYAGQPEVETLNNEPFVYPMMRIGTNVLIEMFPCLRNRLVGLLLEAQNLPRRALVLPAGKNFLTKALAHLSQVVTSLLLV